MADKDPSGNKDKPSPQGEVDPVLQGIDRVQSREEIDSRLSSETEEGTEDTHTRSNIHLGGRDDEGIGTGPEQDEATVQPQSLATPAFGGPAYPVPDGGAIEPSVAGFAPAPAQTPEDDDFQSSGRATAEIEIEEPADDRPTTQPLTAFTQAGGITPLVVGENEPPQTAVVDLGATDEDTSTVFSDEDLLANAFDPDGDPLTVSDVAIDPGYGIIIDNGDGTYTFEPAPDFFGDDLPVTYTISDGSTTIPGNAIIDVLPINDPPLSADNDTVIDEDSFFTFGLDDFEYSDIENDNFAHITIVTLPAEGSLTFDGDPVEEGDDIPASDLGLLVFTPEADENGQDYATFDFTVNDGTDDSEQYTFSIDVTPVNDPPTSEDGNAEIEEDTTHTFAADDFSFDDIDGDSLSHITIVGLPDEGVLTLDGNPVAAGDDIPAADIDLLVFTPDADENGADYATFNFTVNDGTDDSVEYTFSIDVTPVNDPPSTEDEEVSTDEDTDYTFKEADFAFNDIDSANMDHITIVDLPSDGTLNYDGNPVTAGDDIATANIGLLTFAPDPDEHGDNYATFNFTVNDGDLDSEPQTITVDVTAVADEPILCILPEKIDGAALYDISQGGEVSINIEYFLADAGYENSHGFYIADSNGDPIGGVVVKDNVKEQGVENITFNTADYPGGVTLGFFIIPDGDTQNPDLESGDEVTFQNDGGVWTPYLGGVALVGAEAAPAYFSDETLNPDNTDHLYNIDADGNQNWEDLWNGGDNDNADVNAFVTIVTCEDEATVQGYWETPIALPEITGMLTDLDGSESLMMSIFNIPDGVELKDGEGHTFTASSGDNAADVSDWDLDSLEVIAPEGTEDFVLDVEAKSTEASNNDTATSSGTITVDILHVPTTSLVDLGATLEDTSVGFTAAQLLANAEDLDGDNLSVSNVAIDPAYGTITDNGDDTYSFDPAADYNGDDLPISYDISDGENTIAGSAIIDIIAVADAPDISLTIGQVTNIYETEPFVINTGNVLETDNGYDVTARVINPDGTLSDALAGNVYVGGQHIGVSGINDGPNIQIGFDEGKAQSEELIISLDQTISSIDVNISLLYEQDPGEVESEIGYYTLYEEGLEVGSGTFYGVAAGAEFTLNINPGGDTIFDQIVFTADQDLTTGEEGHSDYFVNSLTYDKNTDVIDVHIYPITIEAALTDTDGSETLSDITLSGVPADAAFYGLGDTPVGIDNNDGTWTFTNGELEGLYLSVLPADADFELTASVTSTETSNNDTETSSTSLNIITGNDSDNDFTGTAANDGMFGFDGHDVFAVAANDGDDQVQGGSGASWVDTIELTGFSGLDHEVGWTLVLDGGSLVQSTDDAAGEMLLSEDADGTITFDDGGSITFENIEKISW